MKRTAFHLAASIALTIAGVSALSAQGDVLRSWILPTQENAQIALLSDLDGDGVREILLGDYSFDGPSGPDAGALFVLSGREVPPGSPAVILRSHFGAFADGYFGGAPVALGDLNGDGTDDYGCGSRNGSALFSGLDGALIFQFSKNGLRGLGDVNGDGLDDILLGACVHVSGSFEVFYEIDRPFYSFGLFAALNDIDRDGVPDFAAGGFSFHCESRADIGVYSGASGARIHGFQTTTSSCFYSLAAPGDQNGDGIVDLVAGDGNEIQFVDGRTGTTFALLPELPSEVRAHHSLVQTRVGDLNGNGLDDLLVRWVEIDGSRRRISLQAIEGSTRKVLWRLGGLSSDTAISAGGIDWNDDGFPDFLTTNGDLMELRSGAPARRATALEPRSGVRVISARCGAISEEARIGITGHPDAGATLQIHLSGVTAGTNALLHVGRLVRPPLIRRCVSLVLPEEKRNATAVAVAPGRAVATAKVKLPESLQLVGTSLYAQWVLGNPRRPRATSDVLEIVVGMPPDTPTTVAGVVRFEDGTPVAGASVELLDQGRVLKTLPDGSFSFPGVAIRFDPPRLLVAARFARHTAGAVSGPIQAAPGRTTTVDDLFLSVRERALTFGTLSGDDFVRSRLINDGLPDQDVITTRKLPQLLSPFRTIWESKATEFSGEVEQSLFDFVSSGGGLHLSGEHADLVNALVGGGVALGPTTVGPHRFSRGATKGLSVVPNELSSMLIGRPRAVLGVFGKNVLLRSGEGLPVGVAWTEESFIGATGRLTWITETNRLWANLDTPLLVENLRAFLANRDTTPQVLAFSMRRVRIGFLDWTGIGWSALDPGHRDIVALYDRDPNAAGPDGFLAGQWEWAARPSPWRSDELWGPGFYAAYIHEDSRGNRTILRTAGPTP